MNIGFTRAFEKQVDLIRDNKLKEEIADVVRTAMTVKSLNEIPNIKKLKGYKSAYRIRTGNYRIGIIFQHAVIYFMAFAHRKDIYRIFP